MVAFGSETYSKRLLHLVSWSHWFTFFNIIAAILLSSFYVFNEVSPETILGKFYFITTWLSHMAFLTFIGFVLLIFPLTLIYPKTRFIRASASIVFTLGLLLLLLDAFIYTRLGYHLNASSSEQILSLIQSQIQLNSRLFWFVSILLFIGILVFELVVSNYAWKHLRELQKTIFAKFVVFGLVVAFFFSHILHIWADANLEYDILRQDTVLPLSYPSTAKTLLTKYGMFDRQDYIERRTSPLSFTDVVPKYPTSIYQCEDYNGLAQSTFLVLTDQRLSNAQIEQFAQRNSESAYLLSNHIDNGTPSDSLFNLFYSLPSIYKKGILEQEVSPALFSLVNKHKANASLTIVSENKAAKEIFSGFLGLFNAQKQLNDISGLVLKKKLNNIPTGLHVVYFETSDHYQYELFIDALLLSQKNKAIKDNIYISSIGNQTTDTRLAKKPSLFILPNMKIKEASYLTSHMDIQPTLINNWLKCNIDEQSYSSGTDLTALNNNRIIANTIENGMMVFSKDKSVFIDQHGNFQSYSRELQSPITISADFPLMIDGVHFIKSFSKQKQLTE